MNLHNLLEAVKEGSQICKYLRIYNTVWHIDFCKHSVCKDISLFGSRRPFATVERWVRILVVRRKEMLEAALQAISLPIDTTVY